MNAKLFFTLNLLAYMGIGACNGTNINGMDDKKPTKKEIKEEASTLSGSSSSEDKRKIELRRIVVDKLSELTFQKFDNALPEVYKNLLVNNDPDKLEKLNIEPFCIFSFDTPDNDGEDMEYIIKETMSDQIGMMSYFPREYVNEKRPRYSINIKKPWCIAVCSRKDGQEDGHGQDQEYYYIDISDYEDNSIYKMDTKGELSSINRRLGDFISFCDHESIAIKRSLEKLEKRRGKR